MGAFATLAIAMGLVAFPASLWLAARAGNDAAAVPAWQRRLLFVLPVALFMVLLSALGIGLTLKPGEIPSALIDKPVPDFDLPAAKAVAEQGLKTADLTAGKVSVVNVFASWCPPCHVEHPLLIALKARGLAPIHGINYKESDAAALTRWFKQAGNPFDRVGDDRSGRVGIDWGVYGLPETFIVDRDGRIVHKHVGPLTEEALNGTLIPLLERLAK